MSVAQGAQRGTGGNPWWCGEALATAHDILRDEPGWLERRLARQVPALRAAWSLEEAIGRAALLDARVLQLLAARSVPLSLLGQVSALQQLTCRRSQALLDDRGGSTEVASDAARALSMVGRSEALARVLARVRLAARSREPVLIAGESGVGKELVARAIHQLSGDPPDRFVPVNCAAIPRELMESELFGHCRGAFSGAHRDHPGLIRAASGGTLFLDELTELSPAAQAKLLRVMQEGAVRCVGETRERRVAVRFLASTNRPLQDCLGQGELRRDLFYRLQRLVILVPPLRERLEDLPLLVEHFVRRWSGTYPWLRPARVSPAALAALRAHSWPGNIRELENVVFNACSLAGGGTIEPSSLELGLAAPPPPAPAQEELPAVSLRKAEAATIHRAMKECLGNKSRASRLLGISRKQLYVKLRLYGLPV